MTSREINRNADRILLGSFFGGAFILASIGMAMSGFGHIDPINREDACRKATATFYRVQDAPFKSWVGVEYGEANGPRVNGVVHCDDPTRNVTVRLY